MRILRYMGIALASSVLLIGVGGIFFSGYQSKAVSSGDVTVVPTSQQIGSHFFDLLKNDYASIDSVQIKSVSNIVLIENDKEVRGEARLRFAANGNKYLYESAISENLNKAGLMRDLKVWYDGSMTYLFDHQAGVLSFQPGEDKHLPVPVPNPLFLPLDFLSADDDECVNCRLQLADIKAGSKAWEGRRNGLRLIHSAQNDGFDHQVIEIPGGVRERKKFDFRVRLVGRSDSTPQINSISLTTSNNLNLVEILFTEYREVSGFRRKIPFKSSIIVRDDSARVIARIETTINEIVINDLVSDEFAPNFDNYAKVWDSQNRKFLKDN